jgi:hormone-sensitive lipase
MEIITIPVINDIFEVVEDNLNFFLKMSTQENLILTLTCFKNHLQKANEKAQKMQSFASEYDFDDNTPGNGYRTSIAIFHSAVEESAKLCNRLTKSRGKFFFRSKYYER